MRYSYTTNGVCSRRIEIELDGEDRISEIYIEGGCHGNLQGIAALLKGQEAREVIERLEGIDCRNRGTSCPDQIAKALTQMLQNKADAQSGEMIQ